MNYHRCDQRKANHRPENQIAAAIDSPPNRVYPVARHINTPATVSGSAMTLEVFDLGHADYMQAAIDVDHFACGKRARI
jgi:hypothetical protein